MNNILKQFIKGISWLLIGFIILTLIITLTRLSRTTHVSVDIDSMGSMQKEIFLRRYGGNLSTTNISSAQVIKNDVINYYKMLSKGDLGWTYEVVRSIDSSGNHVSYRQKVEPVKEIIKSGFLKSIKLLSSALGIAIILGILKGVSDSKKEKKNNSTFKLFTTVIGLSIPVIFIVPLLQVIVQYLIKTYGISFPTVGDETLKHMILPIIALSILPTMYVARITAVSLDKAYEDEYVRTAISKGSSRLRVLWTHVFRNSIVEVVDSFPSVITIIISDLALVEYLFNYKGLTYMIIDYYNDGQPEAVTGLALALGGIFLVSFFLIKLLKFFIDPKERGSAI